MMIRCAHFFGFRTYNCLLTNTSFLKVPFLDHSSMGKSQNDNRNDGVFFMTDCRRNQQGRKLYKWHFLCISKRNYYFHQTNVTVLLPTGEFTEKGISNDSNWIRNSEEIHWRMNFCLLRRKKKHSTNLIIHSNPLNF